MPLRAPAVSEFDRGSVKLAVTILIFCVAALLALGLVMLYSSSMALNGARLLVLQTVWCGIGLASCMVMALVDYRILRRFWWVLFGATVALLALVLVSGTVHGHARRWFSHGGVSFQPSEFGKIALIIALAWYGERYQRKVGKWIRGIAIPGLMIGVTAGLIFKEPDVGNALLVCAVGGILLLISGIRLAYIVPPAILLAAGVGLFIYHNPMRSQRVVAWMHPEETRRGKGQQAYEAMIAFGSGGLTGKGLGDGRQKLGFVPEQHTDFILSTIGEELGLAATLPIVAAYMAIILCGIYISVNAHDTFGLLLGTGLTFLIGLQAFINVAVVTSVLPNKGLPLPFISYGGSNLVVMLSIIGILLSIARRARLTERSAAGEGGAERLQGRRSADNPFKGALRAARSLELENPAFVPSQRSVIPQSCPAP